jgi:hypothetical protein
MSKILLIVLLGVGACAAGKAPIDDDFSGFAGLDQKSDAFSSKMKIVGSIAPGQTSATIRYSKSPRYRALQLAAKGSATLDVWVRSTRGDAVAWLLSSTYAVLASNDDADDTTLDSHLVYQLPAGGATYWIVFRDYDFASHNFTVQVAPLAIGGGTCDVGYDVPDEPPSYVANWETIGKSYTGSFQVYDGTEPSCLDFSDPAVRAAIAEDVRANSGIDWQDATPPVVQGDVKVGATDFDDALAQMRNEVEGYAKSTLTKSPEFTAAYQTIDADETKIIGDSVTNPGAYLEFDVHVEAEECSQDGRVRVDTRTGEVLIVRVHGC